MDTSIQFYTEVLGLKLTNRFGNDWATVSAGEGLTIDIHPVTPEYPAPGTKGSVILGLEIDVPHRESSVPPRSPRRHHPGQTSSSSEPGNFVTLEDPRRQRDLSLGKARTGIG